MIEGTINLSFSDLDSSITQIILLISQNKKPKKKKQYLNLASLIIERILQFCLKILLLQFCLIILCYCNFNHSHENEKLCPVTSVFALYIFPNIEKLH